MEMQNVKNLTITEGNVKTIHDKNNQLIWGAVGYDTKYAGDTYQQTYSGANLFNNSTITFPSEATLNPDGSITVVYDNTNGSSTHYTNLYTTPLNLQTSTEYAAFAEILSLTGSGTLAVIGGASGISQFTNNRTFNLANYATGDIIKAVDETKSDFTGTTTSTRTYVGVQAGLKVNITFRMSLIADTSVTPETFVYQPYTGGIPAPNPDYPQAVQVVTGEQTVKVTGKNLWGNISSYSRSTNGIDFVTNADGTITARGTATATAYSVLAGGAVDAGVYLPLQAGTYTLSEKNGNKVQAVVAQSGGAIIADTSTSEVTFTLTQTTNVTIRASITRGTAITGTLTFYPMLETGSSPTSYQPYQLQSYTIDLGATELCKIGDYQDYIYKSGDDWYVHKETSKVSYSSHSGWNLGSKYGDYQGFYSYAYPMVVGRDTPIFTNYFRQVGYTSTPSGECTMDNASSTVSTVIFYSKILQTSADLDTYFANEPMELYIPLKSPTDTKITDAILISQLDAVHEWLTRYGYSSTVTGNLPIIINQTNL